MDVIGNGTSIELEEDELDQKPIIVKTGFTGDSTSKICHSAHIGGTKLSLQMPLETYTTNEIPYRVLSMKSDNQMDGISESNVVPVTPILASALTDDSRLSLISSDSNSANARTVVVSGGQVFVLSEPTSTTITQTGRSFLPRPSVSETIQPSILQGHRVVTTREEKRRVTHNEVERRRRDKINNWICKLANVLPEDKGFEMHQKTSSQASKGLILSKACEYIGTLQSEKETLTEKLLIAEKAETYQKLLQQEIRALREENSMLKNENSNLKAHIGRGNIS